MPRPPLGLLFAAALQILPAAASAQPKAVEAVPAGLGHATLNPQVGPAALAPTLAALRGGRIDQASLQALTVQAQSMAAALPGLPPTLIGNQTEALSVAMRLDMLARPEVGPLLGAAEAKRVADLRDLAELGLDEKHSQLLQRHRAELENAFASQEAGGALAGDDAASRLARYEAAYDDTDRYFLQHAAGVVDAKEALYFLSRARVEPQPKAPDKTAAAAKRAAGWIGISLVQEALAETVASGPESPKTEALLGHLQSAYRLSKNELLRHARLEISSLRYLSGPELHARIAAIKAWNIPEKHPAPAALRALLRIPAQYAAEVVDRDGVIFKPGPGVSERRTWKGAAGFEIMQAKQADQAGKKDSILIESIRTSADQGNTWQDYRGKPARPLMRALLAP